MSHDNLSLKNVNHLYGKPASTALLRRSMMDFQVFEILPFTPCNEGEHLYIYLRKTGANTVFVAQQLAKYFSVKENKVSYAGLKDRFAVTEQWFSIHLPGKKVHHLKELTIEGVEILSFAHHNKKLRIGALSGNRFELTLRNVSNVNDIIRRWHVICEHGVPNYFGEQRFGIDGGNIAKALAMFSGKKVNNKQKRSMYLSSARSLIFNQIVSERIEQQIFNDVLDGDVLMLAGTQSVFFCDKTDNVIKQRLKDHDLDITASMWGKGELMTKHTPETLEQKIANDLSVFCQGLEAFSLKQERRRIRLLVNSPKIEVKNVDVTLSFNLPAGAYATTVLRELVNYTDLSTRENMHLAIDK